MSNKLKWPHSLFSRSISSSDVPSLHPFLSFSPSLFPSVLPPLTRRANCDAVVQHARQPASQHAGLSPIIHNHNRQKGYMQTTDGIALKLRAEKSGRRLLAVDWRASKEGEWSSQRNGDRDALSRIPLTIWEQSRLGKTVADSGFHMWMHHRATSPSSASLPQASPRKDQCYKRITHNCQLQILLFYFCWKVTYAF